MDDSRTEFFSIRCTLKVSAIFLLMLPLLSLAQDTPRAARLRALTGQLTEIGRGVKGASRSELRQRNSSLIGERGDLLYELLAGNPSAAAELSFQPEVADRLRAEFPEASDKIESQASLESPIIVYVADNSKAGTSRTSVQMEDQQGKLDVYFAGNEPEGTKSGDVLRIRGIRIRNRVAAIDATIVNTATLACTPLGDQKTAVLLVNFPGTPAPPLTTDTLRSVFFSSTLRSVDSYWRENSYNQASASGDAFGPYTLDRSYSCDETGLMWTAAIQAADATVDFRLYSRYFVIFPTIPNCSFTAIGTLGCGLWNSPAHGGFTGSVAWEPSFSMNSQDGGVSLSAHEGGHGLGLAHSRSKSFSGEALGPLGTPGVTLEYGDPYAAMAYSPGQYAAPHKALLGWLAPESNYHTVQTSGVFTIAPIETTTTGMKALKVQRGTGNSAWLWIEYRQPLGSSDTLLQGVSFSGAVVHYEDSTTLNYSDLLDFTPQTSTTYDAPLASWSDPYSDLTLLVLSATPSGLTVSVQYGPQSGCSLVIPSVSLATSAAAVPPGQTIDYAVAVRNNDTAACSSPRTFTLSSPQPNGWGTVFTSSTVTLAPQQSTTVTLTKSVPPGTFTGTQTVTAIAADATNSGSGTATVIVAGPSIPQPVSVTPSGGAGNPNVFSFVFNDPDGFAQILSATILFNSSLSFPNACHINYEPGNNRFFLANDGETGYLGPVVLGSFQTVENSQCRLSGAGSSAVGSGTTLTVNVAIGFKASYLGAKNIYMQAQNYFMVSGWQQMGSWTITAPQVPGTPSAPSPVQGATGVPTNPILSWTAGAGATWYDVYFGTSPSPPFAVSTPVLNFSPGILTPGATYYWKVAASSTAGSTASPIWSFTTLGPPDFSLTVTPPNQSVLPGGSASYTATIATSTGFTGSVSLTATGLPAGATASFSPVSVSGGSGSALVTIATAPSTPAGTFAVNISGVSGTLSHSGSINMTVQAATTLAVASAPGPFEYGAAIAFTATISPSAATGVIQFTDGSNPLGTATLSGGTATLIVSSLTVGDHQINASYAGNYLPSIAAGPSVSIVPLQSIPQPVSVTPSGGSGNPSVFSFVFTNTDGPAQILSAQIIFSTSVSALNTCFINYEPGNNRFFLGNDGATGYLGPVALGSFQTVENSQCRLSGAGSSAVGSGTTLALNLAIGFKASYLGAKNIYMQAQNSFVQSGWQQMGAWTVTAPQLPGSPSTPSPVQGATGVPVNPALSWTAGAGATWYDVYFGTSPAPPFAVSTAVLNFSPGILAQGATYYWQVVSTSAAGSTASPIWSFTTLAPDFSLTVTPPSQSVIPGGSASYTATIAASNGFTGSVSLAATGLPAGATASFSPGSVAGGSGSALVTITTSPSTPAGALAVNVNGVSGVLSHSASIFIDVQAATTLSLTSTTGPFVYGKPISLTATISPRAATGVIQFVDGSNPLGTATLSGGTATLIVPSLTLGSHQIKASYAGNGLYLPSISAGFSLSISKAPTSLILTSSLNPAVAGQSVTFTATVTPSIATGSVQFLDGPTALGMAPISNGSAALSVASLASGMHSIKAAYNGDTCCEAKSAMLTEAITPGAPSNLTAAAISSTYISLNWSASSTAGVTYNVYAGSVSGFVPGRLNRVATGVKATTYSNTGLSPSSTHYYVVTAQNSGGESAPSNQASATTQ